MSAGDERAEDGSTEQKINEIGATPRSGRTWEYLFSAVVLVVALGLVVVRFRGPTHSAIRPSITGNPGGSSSVQATPRQRLNPQFRQDAMTALAALDDLHAAVKVGVLYADYSRRVADTNVAVDRFLRTWTAGPEASRERENSVLRAISKAMDEYKEAVESWQYEIKHPGRFEEFLQGHWRTAAEHIELARKDLAD